MIIIITSVAVVSHLNTVTCPKRALHKSIYDVIVTHPSVVVVMEIRRDEEPNADKATPFLWRS